MFVPPSARRRCTWCRCAPAAEPGSRFSKRSRWARPSSPRRWARKASRSNPAAISWRQTPRMISLTRSSGCSATPPDGRRLETRAARSSNRTIPGRRSRASSKHAVKRWLPSMHTQDEKPSVVLICHEQDRLDTEGLASWLANSLRLAGLIIIRDPGSRRWRAARREIRRVGWVRFLDVIAFRLFARLRLARREQAWKTSEIARLRRRYPSDLASVPRIVVSTPNSNEARQFLERL